MRVYLQRALEALLLAQLVAHEEAVHRVVQLGGLVKERREG